LGETRSTRSQRSTLGNGSLPVQNCINVVRGKAWDKRGDLKGGGGIKQTSCRKSGPGAKSERNQHSRKLKGGTYVRGKDKILFKKNNKAG